jgi:glycerophosphoryl diester phosphodiesterase
MVVAHRGASAYERENTLDAFRLAAVLGADWVELDVRTTVDGVLVVHHDPHLGDDRVVAATPSSELPGHVPTLEDALVCCEALGVGINVEIKALPGEADEATAPDLADAVVELLVGRVAGRPPERLEVELLVTCFDPRTLARVRASTDLLPTGLLVLGTDDPATLMASAADAGHRTVNPWDAMTTPELVEAAHGAGLVVNVWTVDDPIRLVELAAIGVDGLITNVPDVARAALPG